MIVAALLTLLVGYAVRQHAARRMPSLVPLLTVALIARLAAVIPRYWVAYGLYGGTADAEQYHDAAARLAPAYRGLHFSAETGSAFVGTGSVKVLTGLVYAVTGTNRIAGFVVFSLLGYVGLYCFLRAARIVAPNSRLRSFALGLFFLPSMLFWPSSMGKEAPMTLALGIAAVGVARVVRRRPRAWPMLAAGLALAAVIRPHIALMVFLALGVALVVRARDRSGVAGRGRTVAAVAAFLALGFVLIVQTQDRIGTEDLAGSGKGSAAAAAANRSDEGGSAFSPMRVRTPLDAPLTVPVALVTAIVRPFPFEVRNVQGAVAGAESLLILVVVLRSRRRVWATLKRIGREPWVAFASTYVLLFAIAFSNIGNFGILTRQRVQVLPFVLSIVTVDLPAPGRARRRTSSGLERASQATPGAVGHANGDESQLAQPMDAVAGDDPP